MVVVFASAFAADEEVVVVGEGEEPTSTPSQVTVIEVGELPSTADVAAAVERAPGVVVRRLGGQGDLAQVGIRGAGARQTEVLVDGIPLNPEGGGAVDLSELPLAAFERVEVYRGAAPVLLGTTALGGAVSLVPGDHRGATLAIGGGSFGTGRATATVGQELPFGHFWAAVDGLITDGDFRYLDDGGTLYNEDDDRIVPRENNDTGLLATLERLQTDGDLRLTVLHAGLWRSDGVPGFTFAPSPTVRYAVQRQLVGARLDGAVGATALGLRTFGVVRDERLSDPNAEIGIGGEGLTEDRITAVGADGTARIPLRRDLRVDVALGGRSDRYGARGRQVGRGVLSVPVALGDLDLVPGLIGLAVADDTTRWLALPRLGGAWRGDGWALKGNVGAFARPPDLTELYGDRGALVGNPALEAERGVQADLGPTWEREGVRLEVVGFYARYRDLIVWTVGPQGVARPENVDRADVGGVELAAAIARGPWRTSANATVNRAVNRRDDETYLGRQLPRVPVFDALVAGGLTVGPVSLSVDGTLAAGTWADTANFHRLPARTFVGATAEVDAGRIAVELDLRNALNTLVADVALDPLVDAQVRGPQPIVDFTGYPLPGRSLFLTVRLTP